MEFGWRGLSLAGALLKASPIPFFSWAFPRTGRGRRLPGGPGGIGGLGTYSHSYSPGVLACGVVAEVGSGRGRLDHAGRFCRAFPELRPEDKVPWRYLPRRSYQASLSFHDTFLPTENLEVWFDLGVRGRDPMAVPFPEEVAGRREGNPDTCHHGSVLPELVRSASDPDCDGEGLHHVGELHASGGRTRTFPGDSCRPPVPSMVSAGPSGTEPPCKAWRVR